jgi:hypothetical protein
VAYERRLGWSKLPTEVFECAKKSLKREVSTPPPSAPNQYNTLKIHLSTLYCGAARGLTDTTGGHVSMESLAENETLAISTPVVPVRHARPWCPPAELKAVAQLLWMSRTPEGTQPRCSGQIHPLVTPSSSERSS